MNVVVMYVNGEFVDDEFVSVGNPPAIWRMLQRLKEYCLKGTELRCEA